MSDTTIERIRKGKGLEPIPNSEGDSNNDTKRTTERKNDEGITYQLCLYTLHQKKDKNNQQ